MDQISIVRKDAQALFNSIQELESNIELDSEKLLENIPGILEAYQERKLEKEDALDKIDDIVCKIRSIDRGLREFKEVYEALSNLQFIL